MEGQKVTGSTKIPVKDMAMSMLDQIFPQLTPEQIVALKNGTPVPPSPDWAGNSGLVPESFTSARALADSEDKLKALRQACISQERTLDIYRALDKRSSNVLVTCILVFGDSVRLRRAKKAVNQFVAQTYPNKKLIIVNATETPVTTVPHREIHEMTVPFGTTTGAMRNAALDYAKTDNAQVVYPHWDDDDIYDPLLLTFMMQHFTVRHFTGKAMALSAQIRLDIVNAVGYVHIEETGIPNTMLVPYHAMPRYEDVTGGEDRIMWDAVSKVILHNGIEVIPSHTWPLNTLKIVVHDGNNVQPVEQFMLHHSSPESHGRLYFGAAEIAHVTTTLASFGLRTETKPATETSLIN